MTDVPSLYQLAVAGVLLAAAVAFVALFFITAPYGRHTRPGWGPSLPSWLAWMVMEAPSPIGVVVGWWLGGGTRTPAVLLLLGLWLLHYVYRAFVYPLRLRAGTRPAPLLTTALAFVFNCVNGPLNGYALAARAPHLGGLADAALLVGVALFLVGWAVNHHADAVLRRLRAPGETGYRVPQGGLYRWVSCPNYLGEIVEWCGFALAARTGAALAFAVFAVANLLPRALSHHRWYRDTFPDYPPERRALLPGVL